MLRITRIDHSDEKWPCVFLIEFCSGANDLIEIKKWLKDQIVKSSFNFKKLNMTTRYKVKIGIHQFAQKEHVVETALLRFSNENDATLFKLFWSQHFMSYFTNPT